MVPPKGKERLCRDPEMISLFVPCVVECQNIIGYFMIVHYIIISLKEVLR